MTALMLSIEKKNDAATKFLLDRRTDLNAVDNVCSVTLFILTV